MDKIELTEKFFRHDTSPVEEEELFAWLMENDSHRELFFSAMPVLGAHEVLSDPHYMSRKSRVMAAVERGKKRKARRIFTAVASAAAVVAMALAVPALTGSHARKAPAPLMAEWVNVSDTPQMRTLEDGSTVYLMPGARVSYNVRPTGEEVRRLIELDGEAYFNVARDTAHPLTVNAGGLGVEVLGTKFNVRSGLEGSRTEVILEEGSVRLLNADGTGLMRMHPNQMAVYDSSSSDLEVSEIRAEPELIVRYDMVSLNNATLSEVVQSIEKYYSVKLKVSGASPNSPRYNVNLLKSSNIDNVLSIVEFLTGTKMERQTKETNQK